MMKPDEFKTKVQDAYTKAMQNTNMWVHHIEQSNQIFDGIAVYGREAGVDLIETAIGEILREAVRAAEAKKNTLTLRHGKTGKAALAGMVETLRELTGTQVTDGNGAITLMWARTEPDLV